MDNSLLLRANIEEALVYGHIENIVDVHVEDGIEIPYSPSSPNSFHCLTMFCSLSLSKTLPDSNSASFWMVRLTLSRSPLIADQAPGGITD